ncbi:MAG TPA: rod shape-determining protein MreC, partial [Sulfurovum sp.]|nr:rod shape-determining protein MreC [Sulfurovum sp.]
FIPKWHKLNVGDKVITSGLDGIFFANVPVGIVTKIEVQSSYTVAYIKTYSDVFHPETFFLINDASATLAEGFDSKETKLISIAAAPSANVEQNASSLQPAVVENDINKTTAIVSSIPKRIDQTQEEVIEPESIAEVTEEPKKIKNNAARQATPSPDSSSFDLF